MNEFYKKNGIDTASDPPDWMKKVDEVFPVCRNCANLAGLGATFAGDYGYLGPAFGTIAPNGSNISPQAPALLQLKLPNGWYLVPTPQTINKSKSLEVQGLAALSYPGFYNENQFVTDGDYLRSDRNKFQVRYFESLSNQESTTLFSTEGFPLFTPQRFVYRPCAQASRRCARAKHLYCHDALGRRRSRADTRPRDKIHQR